MLLQDWSVGAIRALRWWVARTVRRRGPKVFWRAVPCNNGCGRTMHFVWPAHRARRRGRHGRLRVYCSARCRLEKQRLSTVRSVHNQRTAAAAAAGRPAPPLPPELESLQPRHCPYPYKLAFLSEAAARAHFTDLLRVDPILDVYVCRCGYWHAGHRPGSGDRATWPKHLSPPTLSSSVETLVDPEVAARLKGLFPTEPGSATVER